MYAIKATVETWHIGKKTLETFKTDKGIIVRKLKKKKKTLK